MNAYRVPGRGHRNIVLRQLRSVNHSEIFTKEINGHSLNQVLQAQVLRGNRHGVEMHEKPSGASDNLEFTKAR